MKLIRSFIKEDAEQINLKKLEDAIKTGCRKFLSETDAPLYRGLSNVHSTKDLQDNINVESFLTPLRVNKNRLPTSSPIYLHNFLNLGIQAATGVANIRSSSIFCTYNYYSANSYGIVYCVFPIGKYEAVASDKVSDAFIDTVVLIKDIFDEAGITCFDKNDNIGSILQDIIVSVIMWAIGKDNQDADSISDLMDKMTNVEQNAFQQFLNHADKKGELEKVILFLSKQNKRTLIKLIVSVFSKHYKKQPLSEFSKFTEIMIQCDSYYAIPTVTLVNLLKIDNRGNDQLKIISDWVLSLK